MVQNLKKPDPICARRAHIALLRNDAGENDFSFFTENHNCCSKDVSVQIIDHCDPNDKERREGYWIETLETSYPKGLNHK